MDDLSIVKKPELARCPRCQRLMDVGMRECPHCKAFLTKSDLQAAANLERETNRRKSRINDRNGLIYGIFSLVGAVILAGITVAAKLHLWRSQERANIAEIAGHLWLFVRSNLIVVVVFVLLPLLLVVVIRSQRRD